VVSVAGCTGSSGTTARAAATPAGAAVAGLASSCLSPPASCYAPDLFRVEYGIQALLDRGVDGRGETVTLLDAAPPGPSALACAPPCTIVNGPETSDIRRDLAAFDSEFRLPAARIAVVTSLAGSASSWQVNDQEAGDAEIVHAVAPAATLRLVLLPSTAMDSAATATAGMIAGLRLAVSGTDVASIGFGLGEHFFTPAQAAQMHSILSGAEAHHVTVLAGSGDNGAFSDTWWFGTAVKEVSLPASDPLVLAVGGTALAADPVTGAYISETAWNAQNGSFSESLGASGAASATCMPVPPTRTASPGSGR
jgi:subtilase family serine protease